jgi:ribosomal protein L7/L12
MQPEWILGIAGVLIAIIVSVSQGRKQSRARLSAERYAELNALLIDEEVIREQLRRGNKINAIKSYRVQTRVGLKEAKNAVEMMEQERQHTKLSEMAEMYKGDDAIERMLVAGNKIKAIKLYRERNGVGLKEAKGAVEMMMELKAPPVAGSYQSGKGYVDPNELQRLISAGEKIQAIKYYRETTGVGLKEAKDSVEALIAQKYQNT